MKNERWWHVLGFSSIIVVAAVVAFLFERECQKDLAFQRAFTPAPSESIVGSTPVKCWFP